MSEPKFGNCRDCLAWLLPVRDAGQCRRHAPTVIPGPDVTYRGERVETHFPMTHAEMGCFDHIPKPETTHV